MSESGQQRRYGSYDLLPAQPDVQCLVCTRPFALDAEVADSFEALAICRECKMTVLSDRDRDETPRTSRQRRRRSSSRQWSIRVTGHEAPPAEEEDAFPQQFSQLVSLARQGREADAESPTVPPRQHASYSSTPSRSLRWHTSDDESDGLSYADSVFGIEIESNISFGDEDGGSDASVDRHAMVGREIVIQLGNESYVNTDTDIDPMNAGVYQWDDVPTDAEIDRMNAGMYRWDSDDNEDDDVDEQSEESDSDEAGDAMQERQQQWHDIAPSGLNEQESEGAAWTWRTAGSHGVNRNDLRVDIEGREIRRVFIGDPGDYVDARQFEVLLEQFAEDTNSRRGAPPAAASCVENLSSVVISKSYERNGGVTCPVCKDDMAATTVAKQLPCMHLYHSSCILPWLSSRNTCPVCRYELPTDDPEYERSKHATVNEGGIHGVERTHPEGVVEETNEPEFDGSSNTGDDTMEEANTRERAVPTAQQPNGAHGRHRWLFIAAAPVVSLVSLALVLCFTNTSGNVRRQLCRRP